MRLVKLLSAFALLVSLPLTSAGAVPLATATVGYRNVERTYDTVATIEAEHQSTVSAETSGRITAINFRAGDSVHRGQVIMRIDTSVADQQMAAAAAHLHEAQVQEQNAHDQFQRIAHLLGQHFVSQAQYDQAQADLRSAQARVRSLQANLAATSTTRGFATIVAPYSGVMSQLLVEVGDMAAPGTPLAVGFDPQQLRATSQLPQSRVALVRSAGKAYIELDGATRWLPCDGMTLLPAADPKSHTTEVRLHLAHPDGLLPGQLVNAHFVIGSQRRLVIPRQSTLQRSELTAVYVIDRQGHAQLRQVRLGQVLADGLVEVLAGLQPGEKVALDPIAAGQRG